MSDEQMEAIDRRLQGIERRLAVVERRQTKDLPLLFQWLSKFLERDSPRSQEPRVDVVPPPRAALKADDPKPDQQPEDNESVHFVMDGGDGRQMPARRLGRVEWM